MPNPNATNPRTGKRYGWEAAQAQAKADAKANPAPDDAKHLALLKRQKKAIEARSHFLPFIEFTMPDPEAPDDVERSAYKAAKHHRASARVLEDVERGNIPMLIFVMPPRHGKSEQVSRRFPAWYSGRHPRQNVVVSTYSDTFAATFGKEVRSIIRTPQFRQVFPTYRLQRGGEGSDFLMNTEGGQLVFVGRGGGLTGRGAHCFPAETRVETSRGSKRIADVLPGDEVLSYDEREGVVYRTVQAVARRPRSRLFRITTVAGRVVEATGDHPFYVAGRWVEAHALTVGDSLLCAVPKDVSSAERRGRQAHEEGPRRVRMFERVLGPQGEREKPRASVVPEMRATGAKEDVLWVTKRRSRLLFEGLHDCREAGRVRTASVDAIATLSAMQCNVHAVEREHSVLRTGVRFASSRRTDGERGQSALEGRDVGESREGARNASLSRDAAFGDAARRNAVHSVRARRNEKSFGGTSRRRECAEQSSGQSDYGVREVSQARAQFERTFDVVASVEETGREADVYDIQVGGTECFFADGVLVHNCLICDDLIKDAAEARSQAIRDEAWSWFTRVAMTRRMGLKLVILTFTRWHADDPIGRLTDPENPHYDAILAAKFKIILLPAIAEEDDPLGREPGDALWPDGPDRFDKEFLDEQRRLDPTGFQALYQGRPSALDGDLFQRENIQWYDPNQPDKLPELRYYCASDHAVGIKQQNDPSCFIRAGLSLNGDLYLTDCVWQRIKTDRAVDEMLRMGAKSGERNPLLWFAESGHISKSIGPFLYRQMAAENAFFNVREIVPSADKPTRAQSMIGRVAQKKVYFPKGVAWAERAVDEMMAFPNGSHDDFVDALSLFGLGLRSMFGASKTPDAKPKPATLTLDWVKQASRWKEERAAAKRIGGF